MPELLSQLLSSESNKISVELIERLYNLGVALNCTKQIDPIKLHEFNQETKHMYHSEGLGWYDMCSAVHKAIEHSAQYLERLQTKSKVVSIGHMSETPLESNNKIIKKRRLNNTRKTDRIAHITDMFTGIFYSSDPVLIDKAYNYQLVEKEEPLPLAVQNLLK